MREFAPLLWLSFLPSSSLNRVIGAWQTVTSNGNGLTCGRGGSIRVWDLSAHDSTASLGSDDDGYRQHSSVVKEIVVFPDGSKAVSCSYDKTAKVWCLRTGRCLVTLKVGPQATCRCL